MAPLSNPRSLDTAHAVLHHHTTGRVVWSSLSQVRQQLDNVAAVAREQQALIELLQANASSFSHAGHVRAAGGVAAAREGGVFTAVAAGSGEECDGATAEEALARLKRGDYADDDDEVRGCVAA